MASFRDVFADAKMTNWLKAWLALNITKAGLLNFVDEEINQLKSDLYKKVILNKNLPSTTTCTSCFTANLLKCPIKGLCKRTGKTCRTAHADPTKQWRPCPNRICDGIRDEIIEAHRFKGPSWKNTKAEQWNSNHWEVAKCFMPPDGYTDVSSIQNTDFNGIINVLLNCEHFDSKFSFQTLSGQPTQPCFLTQARDIVKAVRHSSTCKVTSADLQEFFIIFIGILSDSKLLAQDPDAQEAVHKLKQLETDSLIIASVEMVQLLKDAQDVLIEAKQVTHDSKLEMKTYIEKLEGQTQLLNNRVDECDSRLDECEQKIQHLQTSMESGQKTNSKETVYNQDVFEFQLRLKKYYLDNLQHVPVSPLMPNHDISLIEIYVTPKIHRIVTEKDGKKRKAGQVFKYNDIFQTDEKTKKHVFLQGEPGKGKTTFAAKLVLDWCNIFATTSNANVKEPHFHDVDTLKAYKFVFHIALRESKNQRNLTEMIKKQIIKNIYAEKYVDAAYNLLQDIFEKEKCFVVQDGLDEWCDPDKELVSPFLAHTFQCNVLITTRPWKMFDERLKNSHVDCLLEMEGVMDSSRLSKNILGCLLSEDIDSKHELFNTYVLQNSLTDLVLTPMMLTHIVCLWVDGTILTGSTCEIYSLILDSLLKKNSSKSCYVQDLPFRCFQNTKNLQPNYDHIQSISRAAFYLLFSLEIESSLVFSEKAILQHLSQEQKMFALNSGILSERKTSTLSFKPSTMSFIHKSIQEFLAALYIALNANDIDDVLSAYCGRFPDACSEMSKVFIFVCGLDIYAANRLSCTLNSHYNKYSSYDAVPYFQDMFISGYLEAKANKFEDRDIHLQLHHFNLNTFKDECALKSLLSDNLCNVQSLVFGTHLNHDIDLYDILSSSAHCIECLIINNETTADSQLHTHLDLSLLQRLQKLIICGPVELVPLYGFTDMISLSLFDCKCDGLDMSSFENLRYLVLGVDVTIVPNSLPELRNIEILLLACQVNGLDLQFCQKLECICLGTGIKLLPNGFHELRNLTMLYLNCKCERLDLSSCKHLNIIHLFENVTLLPFALRDIHNLQELTLNCKCDGLDLSSCRSLTKLHIGEYVTLLPNTLRDVQNVTSLHLKCQYDGLDLSQYCNLVKLNLCEKVTLLPCVLSRLHALECITLSCKCDCLDLSSCRNVTRINIGKLVNVVPNSLNDLPKLKYVSLECRYDELDLSSCHSLTNIYLGKLVTLQPNALLALQHLKNLSLRCKCDGLDMGMCQNITKLHLGENITLLPNALRDLTDLEYLALECKCEGLDLSSCQRLTRLKIGKQVTLLPNTPEHIRGQVSFLENSENDIDVEDNSEDDAFYDDEFWERVFVSYLCQFDCVFD